MLQTKWYKLDNAAKIFPPTTTYYDPKIFRFSVILKDNINKNNLEKALDITLKEFPIFNSVLKKGIFWYYLEQSLIKPIVHEEDTSPCEKLNTPLLYEVTYFKNKINLEVYHALSDGTGCLSFFRVLIYHYLNINYDLNENTTLITSSKNEKETNSFEKYYNPKEKIKITKKPYAYQLIGPWYPEGKLKIICGVTNVKKLKDIAHKYNITVTGFLIALIIKSFEELMSLKDKTKPIAITVPIDLRNFFSSKTVRNFFNVTIIHYKFTRDNTPIEEIIKSVDKDLKDSLKPDVINSKMNKMIYLEHFFIIRLIPLFIKNIILKISYKLTRKKQTMGLSNVGIITLPESFKKYIQDFLIFNSTDALELCICSYNDNISLNFSSHFKSSELEKNFFRLLKEYNLDINIYTNEIEGCE